MRKRGWGRRLAVLMALATLALGALAGTNEAAALDSGSASAASCAAARTWVIDSSALGTDATARAGSLLDHGDAASSLAVMVRARIQVAALDYPSLANAARTASLAVYDEFNLQGAALVLRGDPDYSSLEGLISRYSAETDTLSARCGWGSVSSGF